MMQREGIAITGIDLEFTDSGIAEVHIQHNGTWYKVLADECLPLTGHVLTTSGLREIIEEATCKKTSSPKRVVLEPVREELKV